MAERFLREINILPRYIQALPESTEDEQRAKLEEICELYDVKVRGPSPRTSRQLRRAIDIHSRIIKNKRAAWLSRPREMASFGIYVGDYRDSNENPHKGIYFDPPLRHRHGVKAILERGRRVFLFVTPTTQDGIYVRELDFKRPIIGPKDVIFNPRFLDQNTGRMDEMEIGKAIFEQQKERDDELAAISEVQEAHAATFSPVTQEFDELEDDLMYETDDDDMKYI